LFTRAIVRTPARNFDAGLTTVSLGVPLFERVMEQHERYCEALAECGLALTRLDADERYPDSTFVEETAVITEQGAILMRPGAESRAGEVEAIRPALERFFAAMPAIVAPGTVDGGDVCEAGEHFFLGLSHRTNEEGARQLAEHLTMLGYSSSQIDVRQMTSILHLKSGIAFIGENTLVVMDEMADRWEFAGFELVRVSGEERYVANCVQVNERVLVAEGFPGLTAALRERGFKPLALDMSEFRKMDGGLSCLSLRF
jgi:dimethylargininase